MINPVAPVNIQKSFLGIVLATAAGMLGGMPLSAKAVQLSDGTTHFIDPPRLVGAATTFNAAYFWSATYYFTLTLPENAGEPLQKIVIAPEAAPDRPGLDLSQSAAFEGTADRAGARLPMQAIAVDAKTYAMTVIFDPPVAPGKTLTIALYPVQNPSSGIYLYGVTAFPAGEKASGQFLGFGRIHISSSDRGFFFRRGRFFR